MGLFLALGLFFGRHASSFRQMHCRTSISSFQNLCALRQCFLLIIGNDTCSGAVDGDSEGVGIVIVIITETSNSAENSVGDGIVALLSSSVKLC